MQITYIQRTPTADEFNILTEAVGWGKRINEIVEEALSNTLCSICAYDGEKLIVMAELLEIKLYFCIFKM